MATFGGDAFAGRVGVGSLYHSGLRAWMVNAGGTGTIDFSVDAAVVEFFARAHPSGDGDTVITAFDGADQVIGAPIMLAPGGSWKLISITGGVTRIDVENLATGSFLNGIDDFGFTPLADMPGIDGDYNASGLVEQGDLDLVLLNWGKDGSTPPDGWTNDLPSGAIDQEELDGVLLNWGQTSMPAASAQATSAVSVPEPATWMLAMAGILAACTLILCRRASLTTSRPALRRRSGRGDGSSCWDAHRAVWRRDPCAPACCEVPA